MILSRRVPSGNHIWHNDLSIKHGVFHCKVRSNPVCWGSISIPNSAGRIPHPLPQGMWRSTCLSNAKSSRWLGTLRRCPAWLLGLKLPLGSCILGYPICEPWCWYIDLTGPNWVILWQMLVIHGYSSTMEHMAMYKLSLSQSLRMDCGDGDVLS